MSELRNISIFTKEGLRFDFLDVDIDRWVEGGRLLCEVIDKEGISIAIFVEPSVFLLSDSEVSISELTLLKELRDVKSMPEANEVMSRDPISYPALDEE